MSYPDFVLLGVPGPAGGVELWASTELSHAELELEAGFIEVWEDPLALAPPPRRRYVLRAGLRRFTVVAAATYPEALAILLGRGDWQPPEPPRRAIGG